MDTQPLDLAVAPQPFEVAAGLAREGYDDSALGVECAWPAAEREALLTLS